MLGLAVLTPSYRSADYGLILVITILIARKVHAGAQKKIVAMPNTVDFGLKKLSRHPIYIFFEITTVNADVL